jgi:ATP-binding protein involved in chromosome partitioning
MLEKEIHAVLACLQVPSSRIAGIDVTAGRVMLALTADSGEAKALEPLCRSIEVELLKLDGITKAQVVLTAERPPAPSRPAPSRPAQKPVAPEVTAIVAVASGKGGVGKSTVAANLAVAAAMNGLRVGLCDIDIFGPSVPILMGSNAGPPPLDDEKRMIPPLAHGIKLMSIGFLVDSKEAMVWRGPMVHSAINQMLREVAWGPLDLLVLDMPPGTGDAQLTIAQLGRLAGAIIVSTPQDLALADARRAVTMFGKVNVPILGLVENMSVYCCPNCGHTAEIFGHGGAVREAEKMGVPLLGQIPLDLRVRELGDSGTPITLALPDSAEAKIFRDMAAAVSGMLKLPTTA